MGLSGVIVSLARLCADEVVVPEEVADSRTPRSRLGPAQTAARHQTHGREGGLFEQPHVRNRAFSPFGRALRLDRLHGRCLHDTESPRSLSFGGGLFQISSS